jgi:hypothetical protein
MYWHLITGEACMKVEPPFVPPSLTRWGKRLGNTGFEELLIAADISQRRFSDRTHLALHSENNTKRCSRTLKPAASAKFGEGMNFVRRGLPLTTAVLNASSNKLSVGTAEIWAIGRADSSSGSRNFPSWTPVCEISGMERAATLTAPITDRQQWPTSAP